MRNLTQPDLALLAFAREVQEKAYAPYSGFRVGAAVYADGEIFQGVNIENAAYGATICAERSALAAAVSAGCTDITAIAIVGDSESPTTPVRLLPAGARRVQPRAARHHGRRHRRGPRHDARRAASRGVRARVTSTRTRRRSVARSHPSTSRARGDQERVRRAGGQAQRGQVDAGERGRRAPRSPSPPTRRRPRATACARCSTARTRRSCSSTRPACTSRTTRSARS